MMGKVRAAVLVPVSTVALVVFGALPSMAASSTATTIGSEFDSLQSDITTVYLPALLALVAIGVGVRLGIKWFNRGSQKS